MLQERTLQFRGINLDIPADDVPPDMWTYGENVFFRDLATQRIPGYEEYYRAAGDVPIFVYPVQRKTTSYWLLVLQRAADTLVISWDGAVATTLHTYTSTDGLTLDWTATDHNGVIILNNGASTPRFWNETGGTMDVLPNWPANVTCRSIRSFKFHLFALGLANVTADSDYEFMWSDASAPTGGVPQTWTAGPDTDAGNAQIASPQGFIRDAIQLRDALVILKDFSAHLVTYVGGNFVFNQRGLYISAGTINARCAVTINDKLILATQDDIVITDGQSMESVCTHEMRRHIFNNSLNPDAIRYCQMVKRHIYDEVWFCYPTEANEYCTEAAIYNTRTGNWGIRPLPDISCLGYGLVNDPNAQASWDSRTTTWGTDPYIWNESFYSRTSDEIVMAQPFLPGELDGYVYVNDRGDGANGADINAEVKREGIVLDNDPSTLKTINQIWLHVDGREGDIIYVQAGGALNEHTPYSWSKACPFVIGSSAGKVDLHSVGRLAAFRFYTQGGAPWRIYHFRVRYNVQGRF